MSFETRELHTRYFAIDDKTVGRTEWVRGEFDAYDGRFQTLSIEWWLEINSIKKRTTTAEIELMISKGWPDDPDGLACYFADVWDSDYWLVRKGHTLFVDFDQSLGRPTEMVFPRINGTELHFTIRKSIGEPFAKYIEFWDVCVELSSMKSTRTCFWSGHERELVLVRR